MRLSWRERLQQEPSLHDYRLWPTTALMDQIPDKHRKQFLRNQQIVAQVLQGIPIIQIVRHHHVSRGRISQLMRRCLGGEEKQPPALTQGLIPYRTLDEKTRVSELPTLAEHIGNSCAFKGLLARVPGLKTALDEMVDAKLRDRPFAQRLCPQAFHGEFKRVLKENHWPKDRYPYTTDSCAYESVRRYLYQRSVELQQARENKSSRSTRNLGITQSTHRAMYGAQIDEHKIDLENGILLKLNEALIPLRTACAQLLVMVDEDTNCILGFYLAPTESPNQQDMLTLLDRCINPKPLMPLTTPEFSYAPGACFPVNAPDAFPMSFGTIHLDNALLHRARSVMDILCGHMGATCHLGLPAMPKQRWIVEALFDYINKHLSHRFASTTGSHPRDPKRESRKNRKRLPAIDFKTLNEALSVILTQYNVTPIERLGNASPLALYQYHCAKHFTRYVPDIITRQWQPLLGSKQVRLHWYTHEHRPPHINFHYARYYGYGLLPVAKKERYIRVTFNRRDLRKLKAYTLTGEPLGELQVSKPWQRFPHDMATRQWIHKNAKRFRMNKQDPLSSYFRFLLENRSKPGTALTLLRVYDQFTLNQESDLLLGDSHQDRAEYPDNDKSNHYEWDPVTAHAQG